MIPSTSKFLFILFHPNIKVYFNLKSTSIWHFIDLNSKIKHWKIKIILNCSLFCQNKKLWTPENTCSKKKKTESKCLTPKRIPSTWKTRHPPGNSVRSKVKTISMFSNFSPKHFNCSANFNIKSFKSSLWLIKLKPSWKIVTIKSLTSKQLTSIWWNKSMKSKFLCCQKKSKSSSISSWA